MKEWTIEQLVAELSKFPTNSKVRITDADTMWTILKFSVYYEKGELWIHPSEYSEMQSNYESKA